MDKLTTLNLTIDRIVIQLIIPGLIASFPYLLLFFNEISDARDFFLADNALLVTFITLISLVGGIILENFGSRIEVHLYDNWHQKQKGDYLDIWYKFLQLKYGKDEEPVGHRYLRNILLRMKFELSVGIALISMTVGLAVYHTQNEIFPSVVLDVTFVYVLPILISAYLIFFEGWSSSKILEKVRRDLVGKFYK